MTETARRALSNAFPRRPNQRNPRRLRRTFSALMFCFHAGIAAALASPDILLFGASLGEARAFTVESASSRGWTVRAVAPTQAIFEQTLIGTEERGLLTIERLLRILAEFREESSGIRVYLRAQEVEWPETDAERMTDVTEPYRDNLIGALDSLRARWDSRRETIGTRPVIGSQDPGRFAPAPATADSSAIWSYAAERYAISRDCELTDHPTQVIASGPGWERHRVHCAGGRLISVDCRHGDCTSSP